MRSFDIGGSRRCRRPDGGARRTAAASCRSPSTQADDAAVELEAVSMVYGSNGSKVAALDALSLTFARGTFTAIMGPSGSGKTTLLQSASGLVRPTKGSVRIGGLSLGDMNERELAMLAPAPRRVRVPGLQPAAGAHRRAERLASAPPRRPSREEGRRARRARSRRARRSASASPGTALRRPAATCRDRARAGQPAGRAVRRRADRARSISAAAARCSSCSASRSTAGVRRS